MKRRAVLTRRERLLAIVPAAALAAAQAAHAQADIQTTVVRLGVPTASRTIPTNRSQISQDALVAIQHDLHSARLRKAFAEMDWDKILSSTAADVQACPSGLDLWARGAALHALDRARELETYYNTVVIRCDSQEIVKQALEHSAYQLDVTGRFQVHATSLSRDLDAESVIARDALLRAAIDGRIEDHIERQEWSDAIMVATQNSDRNRLIQVGWAIIERDAMLARDAFGAAGKVAATDADEEARYGFALASYKLGDLAPALVIKPATNADQDSYAFRGAALAARAHLDTGDRRREDGDWPGALEAADRVRSYGDIHQAEADSLTARTYLAAADTFYEAGAYAEAREFALTAARHPETARRGAMRAAWTDLQTGDNEAAARAFRRLYSEAPDSESADGLVLASAKMGDLDSLGPLARIAGGPLGAAVNNRLSDDAFVRDDFQTAYELAPEAHADLSGVDAPWARQSVAARSARGAPGEGRIRGVVTRSSIGASAGRSRIEAGLAGVSYSSGQAPDVAAVGAPGQPNRDLQVDAVSPFVKFSREGTTRLDITLGTSPIGGAVDAAPIGSASLERRTSRMTLRGRIHATPINETITSFTGRTDPISGSRWGRAIKSGVEAAMRYNLRTDLVVTGGASAAIVGGENIRSNPTYSIEGGVSKTFAFDALKYLAAGPFYQFQSYERNTNFHTIGHGGYFSPQEFHRAGISLNLQTREKRKWIARVDAAAAYEQVKTDAAPVLPNTDPIGPQFGASKSSGMSLSTKIEIGRRLSENWIVSAGAETIASEAYDDLRGGFSLRYTFGKRKRVVSRDIEPDISNRDIW